MNFIDLAPIVLFVYNRPKHTQSTLDALANNRLASESVLYIYCDGPKTDVSEEQLEKISQVRNIAKAETRFSEVIIKERESNIGLANNIINGVTEIVNRHGRIIVLEDDLVTSPYFLQYMNEALNYYEDNEEVVCIHGYVYPVRKTLPRVFFLKGADCWGWATWERGWDIYTNNGADLLKQLKEQKLEREFDFDDSYPYIKMLEDEIAGLNNSWAIKWYASAFLKNKLTLYPGHSLVQNIGNDSSGTHSAANSIFDVELYHSMIPIETEISINYEVYNHFVNYFKSFQQSSLSFGKKTRKFFKNIFK